MKPLSSARTGVERLDDGRLRFSIRHELLAGVTPAMLVWWFNNMQGTFRVDGRDLPRYRIWHPRDHVAVTYVRPASDGSNFGARALIHIQEFFNADPRYAVDVVDEVVFLDETGMSHVHTRAGVRAASMDYSFAPQAGGTLYENSLTVGVAKPALLRPLNRVIRPLFFSEEMGRAWLLHNVEEVGNFQFFLPDLYRAEVG